MGLKVTQLNEPSDSEAMARASLSSLISRVPYYRGRAQLYGPAHEWSQLPLLTRSELSHVPYQSLIPDDLDAAGELARRSVVLLSTSGSSQTPIRALVDASAGWPEGYWQLWGLRHPRLACLTSPACMSDRCAPLERDEKLRRRSDLLFYFQSTAALFDEPDAYFIQIAKEWSAFKPEVILANPVYLHWAVRRLAALGLDVPKPKLILSSYQYASECQLRVLRALSPVAQVYGATELAGTDVALSCPSGHLHVLSAQTHVEVLAQPGTPGEVVISTPRSRSAPLIRYSPGDLGALGGGSAGDCALNRLPTLELHGRIDDVLRRAQTVVTTRELDDSLASLEWLEFYAARQVGDGLKLQYIASKAPADAPEQLAAAVSKVGLLLVEAEATTRLTLSASHKLQLTGAAVVSRKR